MIGGVCVTAYLNTLTPCLFQNIGKKQPKKTVLLTQNFPINQQ
jgi:hypothetical protein